MIPQNRLYGLLKKLNISLNSVLEPYIDETNTKLEYFLYNLEKIRFEIYDEVKFINKFMPDNKIHIINDDYKACLNNNILSLYIPEKLPNLKNKSSYAHNQIIFNVVIKNLQI